MTRRFTVGPATRIPACFCPFCFTLLDGCTSFQEKKRPEPGDFTVCVECGAVLRFDDAMTLLASSLMEIPMHSRMDFATMVTAIKTLRGKHDGS